MLPLKPILSRGIRPFDFKQMIPALESDERNVDGTQRTSVEPIEHCIQSCDQFGSMRPSMLRREHRAELGFQFSNWDSRLRSRTGGDRQYHFELSCFVRERVEKRTARIARDDCGTRQRSPQFALLT